MWHAFHSLQCIRTCVTKAELAPDPITMWHRYMSLVADNRVGGSTHRLCTTEEHGNITSQGQEKIPRCTDLRLRPIIPIRRLSRRAREACILYRLLQKADADRLLGQFPYPIWGCLLKIIVRNVSVESQIENKRHDVLGFDFGSALLYKPSTSYLFQRSCSTGQVSCPIASFCTFGELNRLSC